MLRSTCLRAVVIICLIPGIAGCAGQRIYPALYRALESGDCRSAMTLMAQGRDAYGSNAELLYLLDSAVVAMKCADYPLAQERLHAAEALADQLWTESISRNIAALAANDYTLPYSGEDYERVLIHLMSAIGYLGMGRLDAALVEVRRLDSLLEMFAAEYQQDDVYKKDAFGRYLSGMLHEADGAWDDAFIDYLEAASIYQGEWGRYGTGLPDSLTRDVIRIAARIHRLEEARQVLPQGALDRFPPEAENPSDGKVVVIVFNGKGPHKTQEVAVVPTSVGPIGIAFPRIVPGEVPCRKGALTLTAENHAAEEELAVLSDINQIALQTLADRSGRIVAKAVARTVAKQVVIQGLARTGKDKDAQQAIRVLLNLANLLVLEKADTRCWRTLPGIIQMARTITAPGEYSAGLRLCGNQGYDLGNIRVAPGKTRFFFLDASFCPHKAHQPGNEPAEGDPEAAVRTSEAQIDGEK